MSVVDRRDHIWRAGETPVDGCRCRLCRPGPLDDDQERACVQIVADHGWQVMLVSEGDEDTRATNPRSRTRSAFTIGPRIRSW